MPRRKQGHLHASKRGATCSDRGSRGRSRGRSATASRFGAKSFSPACRKGGRGGSRCRSAMMKTNRVPSAGEESSFTAEDEERYLHKKFQRVDCLSPSTSASRINAPADNDGSSSSEVVKPSKALEALLKVTELEIIRSSNQGLPQNDRDEEKSNSNATSTTTLAEDVKAKASTSTSSSSSISTGTTDEVKKMKLCRHICNYCNHAFAKPSVLEKHIRAHTDERPYPCSLCDFAFKTKSNLYKHCKSRSHALKVNESGSNVDVTAMENNMSSNEETDDENETQSESVAVESAADQRDKLAGEVPRVPPIKMQTLLHNNHLVSVKSGETTVATTTSESSTTASEAKEKEREKEKDKGCVVGENKNQKNCLGVYKPKFHFTLNSDETTNEVETPMEVEKTKVVDSNISGKNESVIQSATTSVETQQERQQQQQQQVNANANENRNKSKATRLATPEYLKQHISNIISRNTAIVETLNPLWSRRFLRQSSVASSQNVDAELRTRDKNSGHSKLANALLRQNEEGALTGSQSLPATPSVMLAAPHFAGGFLSEVKNKLMVEHTNQQLPHTPLPQVSTLTTSTTTTSTTSMAISHVTDVVVPPPPPPQTVASAVKTLLLNKVASPARDGSVQVENLSGEGTSSRKLQDPSGIHPQNPEGSIIKNLLLTKRTNATPSVIVNAGGQQHHEPNFYANQNGSQVNEYSEVIAKNQQEQLMHTCPVCRTSFRSAETLVAHQSHYCKKSERANYLTVPNEMQSKIGMNEKMMKRNNECCVQPKPRGRPKGSKNRPKEILVVQQTTTRSKTNANATTSVANIDTHGKTLNALKGKLVCRQISESNPDSQDGCKEKQTSDAEEGGAILKKHLLMGGDKSPPLKKRKIPQEILPIEDDKTTTAKGGMNTLRSLEELSRYPMRPNAVQMFGGEVQIFDGNDTKKIRIDTQQQQIPVSGGMMSTTPIAVVHGGALGNVSSGVASTAVVVTIAKPVLNSGGTVMQMHDSKVHSTPSVCIPVVALGQPLMATGMLVNQAVNQADRNSNRTSDAISSKFNEVGAVVLSSNIPPTLPINSPGFYSIDISHLQINASTARTNASLSTAPRSPLLVSVVSPVTQGQMSPRKMTTPTPPLIGRIEKPNSSIKSLNPFPHSSNMKNQEPCVPTSTANEETRFNQPNTPARENVIPTIKIQSMNPSSTTCKSITPPVFSAISTMTTSTTTVTTTSSIERPKTFLAPPRPTSLALKSSVHTSMVGTTLISPETPRPKKKYGQLYINGQYYTYLGLKCSTRVYYCCIYRPQPMYVPQGTDSKLSMYSNWQMVPADNNQLNLSPPIAMACYDSRQRSADKYVIAGPRKLEYLLTHSSYWTFKQQKNERNNAAKEELEMGSNRKRQKMNDDVNNSCNEQIKEEISKEILPASSACGVRLDSSSLIHGKHKNKEPFSESPREVKRVRIFEGGYKSNEEYTYIRGRGRGKYVCEECGIRCKKPSMLKKHIRTHTDVRPFTCKHCNFSFKTKGNLTKHMKSKAHHKKCVELGIDPVPVTIDDAHIDEEALAQQERYEKEFGKFTDDDEDDDEDDDDEDDELDDEDDDEEEDEEDDDDDDDDLSSLEKRKRAVGSRVMPGQFEDAVEKKDSEITICKDVIQVPAEEAAARSLLDLSNHGKMEAFALTDSNRPILQELNKSHKHNLTGVYPPFSSIMSTTSHTQTTNSAYEVEKETNTETETEELIGNPRVVWQPSIKRLVESTETSNYVYEQDKQIVIDPSDQTRASPEENRAREDENLMFAAESRSSDDYLQLKEQQRFTPNDSAELEPPRGDVDEPMDLSLTGGTRINFAPGFNDEYSSGTAQVDERRSVLVSPMKIVCESPPAESNVEMYETISPPPISTQFQQSDDFNSPTPLVNTGHAFHRINGTVSPQSVETAWEDNKTSDSNNGGCSSMLHAYLTEKQPEVNVERKQSSKSRSLNVTQERIKQIDYPIIPVATTSSTNFPMLMGGDIIPGKSRGSEFLMPLHRSMDDGKCVCNICNKPFTKPSQLRLHVNIHYFERPFRCDSCAVSFRTKGHLQKHKRSVSHYNKVNMNMTFGTPTTDNPRPFKCIDCKIAFRIHGHLAKHLRSKMHIMKLECLGKLPFGTYAEIERSGLNLSEIDTTDCENSLDSLRLMAQRFYDKDPRRQRCARERTVSGCSTDDGSDISHVTDDSLEGGARYRSIPLGDIGGRISPDSAEVELLSTAETLSLPGVKQEPADMHRGEAYSRHQSQLAAPPWEEIMRQPSMESLGQEYEDISDAESEPDSMGTFSTCSLCRQVFKDTKQLQLHLFVDHPDARDSNGLDMRRGIRPEVPHLRMRSVSMNADAASLMEIAPNISPNDVAVAMEIRRNTLSENAAIAMEMRRANSFSGEKMLRW